MVKKVPDGWIGMGLIIWVVILSILYSTLSLVRHGHFQSGGFDLGLYDQTVWQYSKFLWPYNTVKDRFILGDHLTLTLPLVASLFWIWNDVRMLLIFQAIWISFSSVAIYGIARVRKFSPLASLIVAVLYSLFYGIQYAVYFDFHPVVIGVGLLLWFMYFFERKKVWPSILFLILALMTQENMGIAVAGIGCLYFFQKEKRRTAFAMIVGGIGISLISSWVVAKLSPVGFQYAPSISHNPISIVQQFFDAPEKREVWLYTVSWFSLLPLFSPGAFLAIVMDMGQYFATGPEFSRMWSPFMHHRIVLAIFVTMGLLDVLSWKRVRPYKNIVLCFVVISCVFQQYFFHLPINKLVKQSYWQEESWMGDNRSLIAQVPPDASVATQQSLVPHLSHRKEIYLMYPREKEFPIAESPCGVKLCKWLDINKKSAFLVVDIHPTVWITQLLETPEYVQEALANMEKAKSISLVSAVGDARLYQVHW